MNNRMDGLDKKLDSRFLWLLGIQVTMWVTIILTIYLSKIFIFVLVFIIIEYVAL